MKKFFLLALAFTALITHQIAAQTVNSVTIYPATPTVNDSLHVIVDFTYFGDCSYGMTYSYSSVIGDTIIVSPTYCGYAATTQCNEIDTLVVGPFAAGHYFVRIEFHQGSVCPISGFDATIAFYFMVLDVTTASGLNTLPADASVHLYPNPVKNRVTVELANPTMAIQYQLKNTSGQLLTSGTFTSTINQIDLSPLQLNSGIYFLESHTSEGVLVNKFLVE